MFPVTLGCKMSLLERETVLKVRKALTEAGLEDTVIELADTARTAEDAASAIGCELGAIVKSLVFIIGPRFVMSLISGDHSCIEANLPAALELEGRVGRVRASEVKRKTGYTIGGVPPLALSCDLPIVIDGSLARFDTVYAAAGHPYCIFSVSVSDLGRITGGSFSDCIGEPIKFDMGSAGSAI
ncbi:MAG: aminoacyl-tRNA deacylase [Magnetovibrio sp.]|nr:aminoacyl-tRNA deacylase [Magnetovibrio sp.]|tara:strand:- start:514 stop:1065 length:552 start_codon:yes stop_codon:yes gene_type:complete